jgi:hypothetical protein
MTECAIRRYCDQDLSALVTLINAANQLDQMGYATTLGELSHLLAAPAVKEANALYVATSHDRLVGMRASRFFAVRAVTA